jgi:hypothetical protein
MLQSDSLIQLALLGQVPQSVFRKRGINIAASSFLFRIGECQICLTI